MKPSTIAIVGMAGRFPGARNVHQFWENLRDGVESIRSLSDAELLSAGVTPEELAQPDYVKRASVLDGVPLFDAAFFGLSPRDAAIMDPQHRHFLECAWEAIEDAGHPPRRFSGSVGVFAGSGMSSYLIHNLLANRELLNSAGLFQLKQTGNDKDVLATRVSYQFDLRGPSINVQTACSTSLVAVHLACQSLLNHECDMALAGGVTIEIPHGQGYIYREGEILSRDGRCRSFDAASTGTIFGSGAGVVVLRRLEDALEDHDAVRAVILGSAINNDGARKVGYLAPSVEGQAEVIAEALEFAGVSADEISYVETHGTGTVVGDPIEVRALTQAFRGTTARSGYCRIGSLKSNVGHLDAAAGVAGLIKTVLALEHAQLPPSLHFANPNPHIEFSSSPFFVNKSLADWPSNGSPRRAGVTSLGIGGTNAHVVLEEAPAPPSTSPERPCELFTVSAKTEAAVERSVANLMTYLDTHPDISLADAAFTCQAGRHEFPHRRALVVANTREEIKAAASGDRKQFASGVIAGAAPHIVFMFSGQGSQHVNMGRELYEQEGIFRHSLDLCAEKLLAPLGLDLRHVLFPSGAEEAPAAEKLNQTWLAQPALFAIEYSLAQWWMSLGIEPGAMVGHSIGEYVAACLAGVFSLEDALAVAVFRGRLMFGLPAGAMLAVSLSSADLHLNGGLSLAAINGPRQSVVSGPASEIAALQQDLAMQSVACRRLITSHAFHSAMMDPILGEFEKRMRGMTLHPPRIPYLSNVSGAWIKAEEATDPAYWAGHLRHTVRFSDCLDRLLERPDQILLEVGPGTALTSLARQQGGRATNAFQSLPHPGDSAGATRCALHTLGQLWALGRSIDWARLHAPDSPRRIPLPTYPFEHERFWIEPDAPHPPSASHPDSASLAPDGASVLLYRRVWKPAPATPAALEKSECWLVFMDSLGLGERISAGLLAAGQYVVLAHPGSSYRQLTEASYTVRPAVREDHDLLIADVLKTGQSPKKLIHLWSVLSDDESPSLEETQNRSFYSPLYLAQALANNDISHLEVALVSSRLQQVFDEPVLNPARALLHGPARVIPAELPDVRCRSIDLDFESGEADRSAGQVIAEMSVPGDDATVAFRRGERFVETFEPITLSAVHEHRVEEGGVYLITGGLGGIGLAVAEHMAREFNARLVLVGRSALPPEAEWESLLSNTRLSDEEKVRIRKLIEIRAASSGLVVVQGDVTNPEQMRSVVAMALRSFGGIDGVFHAAGVLDDAPLLLKTAESAARVLDPKVRGTLVLEQALRDVPLRSFVLFSSISSILPAPGQVDYAAANAFLDAFALSRKGPATVINWGAWRDAGMAARSKSVHPFLQERLLETPREIVYTSHLSQARQWALSEHMLWSGTQGKALLPGTGYLEMAAAALSRGLLRGAIEFQNVFFLAPLKLEADEVREVRVQLRRDQGGAPQDNAYRFTVFSRGSEWVEHSTGTVAPCALPPAALVDRGAIAARCREREIVFDEEHRTRQERYLAFGPRWRSLRRLHIGNHEALAEVELEEKFASDLAAYSLHPAIFDLATGASFYLTHDYEHSTDLFLPISYRRICVYNPLPSRLFSHIRSRQQGPARNEVETFDISLFDEDGRLLAEIEGFSARRIADASKAFLDGSSAQQLVPQGAEQTLEVIERPGIRPLDGARAVTQILAAATPRAVIAVSEPLDLHDNLKQVSVPQTAAAVTVKATLPGEGIESTLAGWWREILGVNQVGPDDDFFNLGGHSLVGVRLLAKVNKAYRVDLDFAVLFEARTVRQLADVIRKFQSQAAGVQA